ncbi:inner centromere protein-like [Narcine bancroftii]|uniref:inner centromere protein-like n=1 Tax=Narcine bancroftii TaxID=1343680 RepID=UPI0038318777
MQSIYTQFCNKILDAGRELKTAKSCCSAEAFSGPVLEPEQPEEKLSAVLSPEKDYRNSQNTTEISIINFENIAVAAGKSEACRTSRIRERPHLHARRWACSRIPISDPRLKYISNIFAFDLCGSNSDKLNSVNQTDGCKNSCKNGMENISSDSGEMNSEDFPPRGTAPPLCSARKVIPSKNKSFLHTVRNNQLLMSPVAVGHVMKSFIKRKSLVKVDPKEMIRLAKLKKKQEQEEIIQKLDEEKKCKLEEIKKKQELRLKRVFEARSQVEQQEKKKNKSEQKVSQTDKNEKLNGKKFAEGRVKKKLAVKKMERESQRWQKEDTKRNLLQEEHQETQQKEEELQQQCYVAKIKKLSEDRKSEQERERQHDVHWDAKRLERKKQESFLMEKEHECQAKKTLFQLPPDLEQTTLAQPQKESYSKGVHEKERVWEEQQLGELQSQCFEREETQREDVEQDHQEESKYEDQEIKLKKEQVRKIGEVVSNGNILDKTVEVHHLPDSESDPMTPSSYFKVKFPKINLDNYGMDLNSDDSTDDEGKPRKPIPAWAHGKELQQALLKQYYQPLNLDKFFSVINNPNLEMIFGKRKPHYLKRTSSAVWHSSPRSNRLQNAYCGFVKH